MIDPFKQILEKHAAAQGWDADSREHVLLQFVANAQDLVGAAVDLDDFLTDLTAPDEVDDDEGPRQRCYTHVEQLEALIVRGAYNPATKHWKELDALLGGLVHRITTDTLLEPAAGPRYYVEFSVPIDRLIGHLAPEDEQAIAAAFDGTPGTGFDGSGSGEGYRQFFGTTTEPVACLRALTPLLPPESQISFRRMTGPDDDA